MFQSHKYFEVFLMMALIQALIQGYQENSHRKIPYHQTPPGKFPPRKFSPRIFSPMFLNIPTPVFKFFVFSLLSPSSLILLKRLLCNSKSAKVRNSEVDVSKKLQLADPSLIIGHYYNPPVCFR